MDVEIELKCLVPEASAIDLLGHPLFGDAPPTKRIARYARYGADTFGDDVRRLWLSAEWAM